MTSLKTLLISGLSATALVLTACSNSTSAPDAPVAEVAAPATLAEVIAHPRRADDTARDQFRNPQATLDFFGLEPGMNVGEVWPGWYTKIIAPYLAENGGTYTAILYQEAGSERAVKRNAAFAEAYVGAEGYGTINTASFGKNPTPITDPNSLDMILTFRNVHNWMGGDYADKAFADFYAALKPGGILGVVEHRLPETAVQNPTGRTGYVQESYMKALAKDAGFEFVDSSEVNANPKDTADHPMGVWTLLPRSATPKEGSPEADGFDAALYKNIGESDRATLKFRKPL
ncbi:class I SAM-dependent methyltransferase [Fretibacter rubidus]|uniref:class I SAM-dependent methyltransferase n=1 Tax=Fretibacter rubidus TaxID=570162 RepID=UPI00352BAF08